MAPTTLRRYACRSTRIAECEESTSPIGCTPKRSCPQSSSCSFLSRSEGSYVHFPPNSRAASCQPCNHISTLQVPPPLPSPSCILSAPTTTGSTNSEYNLVVANLQRCWASSVRCSPPQLLRLCRRFRAFPPGLLASSPTLPVCTTCPSPVCSVSHCTSLSLSGTNLPL